MTAAAGVDFFRSGSLPAPLVSQAEAERIAAAQFGLAAHARSLGSQQPTSDRMCVLKIKPPLCWTSTAPTSSPTSWAGC